MGIIPSTLVGHLHNPMCRPSIHTYPNRSTSGPLLNASGEWSVSMVHMNTFLNTIILRQQASPRRTPALRLDLPRSGGQLAQLLSPGPRQSRIPLPMNRLWSQRPLYTPPLLLWRPIIRAHTVQHQSAPRRQAEESLKAVSITSLRPMCRLR